MDVPRTEDELVKFHAYLRDKGLMNPRTAYARAQAAQQVLSVLDQREKDDLSQVDRETTFRRFVNKHGQRFTPDSLNTYKHRFNAALDEFLAYVSSPADFRPSAAPRERTRQSNAGLGRASEKASAAAPARFENAPRSEGLLTYPLPLPSGTLAQLLLPTKITRADAERITSLVSALVNALAARD